MTESELLQVAIKKNINFRFLKICLGKRRSIYFYNYSKNEEEQLTEEEFESFRKLIKGEN